MKKILFVVLLLSSIVAKAQFSQGSVYLQGILNVSKEEEPYGSGLGSGTIQRTSVNVSPSVGYFVNESLAVGMTVAYTMTENDIESDYDSDYNDKGEMISGGLFVNQFFPLSEKFYFSVNGLISYGRHTQDRTYYLNSGGDVYRKESEKNRVVDVTVRPNLVFFPSDNWAINFGLGSVGFVQKTNKETSDKSNRFWANYGTFGLGVSYFF